MSTWDVTGPLTPIQWLLFEQELDSMSEADYQKVVVAQARCAGWKVAHTSDSRRQVAPGVFVGDKEIAGFPDLTLAHPQVGIIFAELKRQLRFQWKPGQREWLDFLASTPGPYVALWKPGDHRLVERILFDRDVSAGPWWVPGSR